MQSYAPLRMMYSTANFMQNLVPYFFESNVPERKDKVIFNLFCLILLIFGITVMIYLCNFLTLGLYKLNFQKLQKGLNFFQQIHNTGVDAGSRAQNSINLLKGAVHKLKSV